MTLSPRSPTTRQIDFSGSPNTIDAAIALTTTGDVGTATLPDGYGSPSSTTVPASVGMQVQKYGRTTGFTTGSINAVNVDVDVCYFPLTDTICFPGFQAHFVNQFSIPDGSVPFSASGDSGSLVVARARTNPSGCCSPAATASRSRIPIDAVLQRFNVTIDSGAPSDGKPSAPFGLQATPGDGQVSLSWSAPGSDGGSQITGYSVYRGTSPGGEGPTAIGSPSGTSYTDTTAANGTTYYYKVTAANVVWRRPTLERGLGDAGRARPAGDTRPSWTTSTAPTRRSPTRDAGPTGSIGSSETGLSVSSNTLACTFSTTCTRVAQQRPVRA